MKTAKQVISLLLILCLIHTFGLNSLADDYIGLLLGDSGKEVVELQKRLTELGYSTKGIDGWYGDGTKDAVKAFQHRNGLNVTGMATVKMQKVLFSDDAKGPFIPRIDIVSVSFDGHSATLYLKNKTDETVDSLRLYIYTYDKSGNLITENKSFDHALMPGYHNVSVTPIASGNTGYVNVEIDSDTLIPYVKYGFIEIGSSVSIIGIAVKAYHTAGGNDYEYSDNQLLVKKSDGSEISPTGDSEPDCMSDEKLKKSREALLGYYFCPITPDAAPLYRLGATGHWIKTVTANTTAEKAGLMVKDVVMAFDNEPAGNAHAAEKAKLRMLNGEEVTVHYLRDNKEYTAVFGLDMDTK